MSNNLFENPDYDGYEVISKILRNYKNSEEMRKISVFKKLLISVVFKDLSNKFRYDRKTYLKYNTIFFLIF